MRNALPRLQYPHDGRLCFVVAICGDALVGFLIFGYCFFELDSVDFDAVLGVGEGGVQSECVGWVDVTTLGVFGQGSQFGACEGLKGAVQFGGS